MIPGVNDAKTMFNRESSARLTRFPVRAFDGRLEGEVEAAGQPTLQMKPVENNIELGILSIPLDKDIAANCAIRSDELDLGGAIANIFQSDLDERNGTDVSRGIEVVAVRDTPVLVARHIVRNDRGVLFDRTMAVTSRDGFSLLCEVTDGGYSQTLLRVVSRFAASLVIADANQRRGVEVFETRFHTNGAIGYCRIAFETRANEGTETKSCEAVTFDKEAGWQGLSLFRSSVTNKAGEFESLGSFIKAGANPSFRYNVKRTGKNAYSYRLTEGETQNSGKFSAPSPVRREASYTSNFKDVISGKKKSISMVEFDSKPGAILAPVAVKESDRSIILTYPDSIETCTFDDEWRCKERTIRTKDGALRTEVRRLFVREPQ